MNILSIKEIENRIFFPYGSRGRYIQTIFDPIQTHALYGITADELPKFKEKLKKLGARKFRTCGRKGFKILCFKINKI